MDFKEGFLTEALIKSNCFLNFFYISHAQFMPFTKFVCVYMCVCDYLYKFYL